MAGRSPTEVLLDELNQTFLTKEPLRIGAGGGREGRFVGAIDDVRIHDDVLRLEDDRDPGDAGVDRDDRGDVPRRGGPPARLRRSAGASWRPRPPRAFQQARKQVLRLEVRDER